ncbi:MAG TPA: polysaccharide biosynthesis C-terminal domain-containing protein [Candidatus Acidoferrales bacterium]|nr:polysaccharide biosynthesis C-terminal domain-containing protein [Candidatus Acidoferrales bacterium]
MQSKAAPTAHQVMSDGVFTFVLRVVNIVAALGLGILTARLLGPAGKGVYALPMVQAGLISTFFTGLASSTAFYLLNRNAGRRIVGIASLSALLLVVGGSVAVAIVALISRTPWAGIAAIVSLPAVAATNLVTGYVTGIKRIRFATTLTFATTLATFALMAVGLFLVARSAWVAIVVWIVATTLVAIVAYAVMLVHARSLDAGEPVPFRGFLNMTAKVGATNFVSLLNYRADLYIVAVLLPPAALGLYTVAVSAAESLLVPTQVAALVTSPHIGGLERSRAAALAARCVRNNMLASTVVCAALFAIAPWIVGLLYGQAFLPLVPALRILLLGVVALSLGSPISSYYTLKLGKPEIPLVLAGLSAAICISVTVLLVPHLGLSGAAIGSTVAYIGGQGLGIAYFGRMTGLRWTTVLIPTLDDLRLYYDFARRAWT